MAMIHRTFEKGYLPGWTEEVFVVHRVTPGPVPTYKIREWDDTPVKGIFYEVDLQKVHVSNQALFRIEKVLKRRKDRLLVKWKGWPDKYNSWIASQDVTPLLPHVLRDVDESRQYPRVFTESFQLFQKPFTQTHSICGTRMASGNG